MSVDQQPAPAPSPSPGDEDAAPAPVEAGSPKPSRKASKAPEATFEPPQDPQPGEDIERLLPGPGEPFLLADGTKVIAKPLRLKEFLGLLKIVTRGAALTMGGIRLNTNDEDFVQSMVSLFLFAIPEADEEASDFLRLMVRPAGPFSSPDIEAEALQALDVSMINPDLEDLFTIIEVVINNEGKDLRRLGKRLSKALEFAQKTGQI